MIHRSEEDEVINSGINEVVTFEFDVELETLDEENIAYCSDEHFEALACMLEIEIVFDEVATPHIGGKTK